ncbi:LysR family transcriptional regulator [Shewanella maritima]|uniref:LysR family transcriptional regulator n=1 Tax=Shewanella maritima TaxID=2520507 RepID=UPI003735E35C
MIDLNALQVFVVLYQTSSTQKAALKLGRSQSYVSKVLANLREDLDDPLFVRTSSGLHPTSYANRIAPKIQNTIEQLSIALEPEIFDPDRLQKISIHIAEPLLVTLGKQLINAIRAETSAIIDIRRWGRESRNMLIDGSVDVGIHIIKDRPQQFYQSKVGHLYVKQTGNPEGEFFKLIVDDFNEHIHLYKNYGLDLEDPTIIIDNYALLNELIKDNYTFRVQLKPDNNCIDTNLNIGTICDASKRHDAKQVWLNSLCKTVFDQVSNNE